MMAVIIQCLFVKRWSWEPKHDVRACTRPGELTARASAAWGNAGTSTVYTNIVRRPRTATTMMI